MEDSKNQMYDGYENNLNQNNQVEEEYPEYIEEDIYLEQPINQGYQQPVQQPVNQMYQQPVQQPVNQMYQQPVEVQPVNQAYQQPVQPQMNQMYQQPAEAQPVNQMYQQPVQQPVNQNYQQPVEVQPVNQMYQQPVNQAYQQPQMNQSYPNNGMPQPNPNMNGQANPQNQAPKESYFDGKLIQLIGWNLLSYLIRAITFTIASPWAECLQLRFHIDHTTLSGRRLKFVGTGGSLFVQRLKWFLLTLVTLGIYGFWIPIKKTKWIVSNIRFADSNQPIMSKNNQPNPLTDSFFDGKLIQLIGINILCNLLNLVSFSLLYPFTTCIRLRWIAKHSTIEGKRLIFDGNGFSLIGHYLLWLFLTLITFGIYGLWLNINITKWEVKNSRIKEATEEYKKDTSIIWLLVILGVFTVVGIALLFLFSSLSVGTAGMVSSLS